LPAGLAANALHEIKGRPSALHGASAADWMAGIGFAARLAVRRIDALAGPLRPKGAGPWILWCWPRALAGEFGSPSAAGFVRLGVDPSRLIIVETARQCETLNAMEEGLRAQSLALVIGALDEADLTPARRLSLAAGEAATPCLLITHPASEPAAATATRWRVTRQPSAPHPFDPRAPGASRFSIALERCRERPESAAQPAMLVEWSDETRRFDLASVVADLPAHARGAGSDAAPAAVRPY
jgi:protein ImuA